MKHLQTVSRQPMRAEDFTTGQKLTLAAGIANALAGFFADKEGVGR